MAFSTIFTKLPASGDNCLIIGNQEALVYPLSPTFGQWTELRIGTFLSYTTTNNDNDTSVSESVAFSSGINQVFIGLKDSQKNALPLYNNFTGLFIGGESNSSISINDGRIGDSMRGICITGSTRNATIGNAFGNFSRIAMPSFVQATGLTDYAKIVGLRIILSNRGQVDQSVSIASYVDTVATNNVSTENLRTLMANTSFNAASTGLFTQNFAAGEAALPIPDSVFFYFPFKDNRLRIHNLVVEKYA